MRVSSRADGRDSCGRYPDHPYYGNPQCSIGIPSGGTITSGPTGTPTGGTVTDFVDASGKRIKVKPLPEAPKIPQLSNVAIIFILKKIWDQFAPVFPPDGYGIQETMDTTVTVSSAAIPFDSDKQYDAFAASSKFMSLAIPLVHALYERPQIKALIKKFAGDQGGGDIDVMKVVYGYLGAGYAGKRYLNRKYFYDLLKTNMFDKLGDEIKYGGFSGTPKEVLENAAKFYQQERAAYNALKTYDAQVLAQWVGSNEAEKNLYNTMLALEAQSDDLIAMGMTALSGAVKNKVKGWFGLNGLGAVTRKMKPEKEADYAKAASKAYSLAQKIDAATTALRTATQNFNKAYASAKPPFDSVPKWTLGSSQNFVAYQPPPILPGVPQTGLAGFKDMDISSAVFKASALGLVGFSIAKKKPLLGILAGVLTFAAFKDIFDAPAAPAPQIPQAPPSYLPPYRPIAPLTVYYPPPPRQTIQTLADLEIVHVEE